MLQQASDRGASWQPAPRLRRYIRGHASGQAEIVGALQVGTHSNRAALQRLEHSRVEDQPWRRDMPAVRRGCAPPFYPKVFGPPSVDMRGTCAQEAHMPRGIQLRNVPDDLHRKLKARAAHAGMSLSDYLLAEARRCAERPTLEELHDRLRRREPGDPKISPAAVLRQEWDHS